MLQTYAFSFKTNSSFRYFIHPSHSVPINDTTIPSVVEARDLEYSLSLKNLYYLFSIHFFLLPPTLPTFVPTVSLSSVLLFLKGFPAVRRSLSLHSLHCWQADFSKQTKWPCHSRLRNLQSFLYPLGLMPIYSPMPIRACKTCTPSSLSLCNLFSSYSTLFAVSQMFCLVSYLQVFAMYLSCFLSWQRQPLNFSFLSPKYFPSSVYLPSLRTVIIFSWFSFARTMNSEMAGASSIGQVRISVLVSNPGLTHFIGRNDKGNNPRESGNFRRKR